ncbi:MAG: LytTR family DNA-binding domain-containing protein [Olsenella sp.]|jgi:DNA-binding LytR/AlgR family response regulator
MAGVDLLEIHMDSVRYFETEAHKLSAVFGGGHEVVVRGCMRDAERLLAARGFVRIHRSHVVNVAHVVAYTCDDVTLDDGTTLPLNRSRLSVLESALRKQNVAAASSAMSMVAGAR